MDGCSIFREELAIRYPTHGHALWEPDPGGLYKVVEVGDVGFIRRGYFYRLFNALTLEDTRSDSDPSDGPTYPPTLQPREQHHIRKSIDCHQDFCSNNVTKQTREDIYASGPDDPPATFTCSGRQGALLYLPFPANHEETIALGDFSKWIVKNIDDCLKIAEYRGCGINMEDIILVTGRHLAKSWISVAFSESRGGAQVSFGVQVSGDSGVHIEVRNASGGELKRGPSGMNLPENQCVFVQGYRVVRILNIWPRIRAAGSVPDLHDPEPESHTQLEPLGNPSKADYPDPLHVLLEYIAEEASDCDMILAHDNDLGFIGGALQSDTLMERIRNNAPAIRQVRCELGNENRLGQEAEGTMVATLSQGLFEAPHMDQNILGYSHPKNTLRGMDNEVSPSMLQANATAKRSDVPRYMPALSSTATSASSSLIPTPPTTPSLPTLNLVSQSTLDDTLPRVRLPSPKISDSESWCTATGQAASLLGVVRPNPTPGSLLNATGPLRHDDNLRHSYLSSSRAFSTAHQAFVYENVAPISGQASRRESSTQSSLLEAAKDESGSLSPDIMFPSVSTSGSVELPSGASPVPPTASSLVNRPQKMRGKLSKPTTDFLKDWLHEHSDHPYPTEDEKKQLCAATGLSRSQVSNWMINARRRILIPVHRPSSGPALTRPLASQRDGTTHSSVSTGTLLRCASMPIDSLQLYRPLSLQSMSHTPSGPVSSDPYYAPSSQRNILENSYGGGRSSSILGNNAQQSGNTWAGYAPPKPTSLSLDHQPGFAIGNQRASSYISSQGSLPIEPGPPEESLTGAPKEERIEPAHQS